MGSLGALLLFSVFGQLLTSLISNHFNEKRQGENYAHDREMAELQKKNEIEVQKTMFDTQNEFNTWQNNKSQMVEAGINPALLIGGSQPVSFGATGNASASSSGSVSPVDFTKMFKSIDPFEVASQKVAQQNADTNEFAAKSNADKNKAEAELAAARTLQTAYHTDLDKRMEKLIIDTATERLNNIKADSADLRSRTFERDSLLQGRLDEQKYENDLLVKEIEREPLKRAQIRADINHLHSIAKLNHEQATTEGYKRSELVSRIRTLEEDLKGSQLERVAKQFGLYQRHAPSESVKIYNSVTNEYVSVGFSPNEKQAFIAFKELGYSEQEATMAVLYYTGVDPKDLVPSVINGASRIISSASNQIFKK